LAWNYNGTLDSKISPIYQYIRSFSEDTIPLGDPNVSYVEHLGNIIKDYKRIYQEMSPYFSADLYTS
jgi:hypothetical protein